MWLCIVKQGTSLATCLYCSIMGQESVVTLQGELSRAFVACSDVCRCERRFMVGLAMKNLGLGRVCRRLRPCCQR